MILDLPPIAAVATLGVPLLLIVMLLPMLFELRKPSDAGPRLVVSEPAEIYLQNNRGTVVVNIEEPQELEILLMPLVVAAVRALPNLDA